MLASIPAYFPFKCMKQLFFLFILLATSMAFSQVTIQATIPDYPEQAVRVYQNEDYFTNKEVLIQTVNTNTNGVVKLQIPLNIIKKIVLKTSQTSAFLYAEPDSSYIIELSKIDTNATEIIGVENKVSMHFLNKNEQSLNNRIIYFEKLLESFYANNNIYFAQSRILQKELLNFKNNIIKNEFSNASQFLKTYIDYSIAPIEEACFLNHNYQFKKYFSDKIIYAHPMYMNYFGAYFKQYLKQLSLKPKGVDLFTEINEMHSYNNALNTILKADTLLKNDTLRELILLTGLREWYYLKDNNRNNISLLMNYISLIGLSNQNRIIAKNLLQDMNALEAGSHAPELVLNHPKYKSIEDTKGNYVYINFWASWNVESLQELKYIQKLEQKYGHRVVFISIATGEDIEAENQYFKNNKLNWLLIHDTDKSIRNQYNIKNIPYYVLIDTEGDIIKGNAPAPSNNMDNFLKQIIKKK
jgi:thiol-disulfide isomerase/thioredoxin